MYIPYKNLAMDIYKNVIRHVYIYNVSNHVSTSQEFQYA